MPNPNNPRSFSGKTERQLHMWKSGAPPEPTPVEGEDPRKKLTPKERTDRFIAESGIQPASSVTIEINDEEIDLADPVRFPNASHDRAAWVRAMTAKIPPGEPDIEQVRFNGDDFGLFKEDGTPVERWNDGQDEVLGRWR